MESSGRNLSSSKKLWSEIVVSEQQEKLIEIGLRIDDGKNLDFFGLDEVNELLQSGMFVKAVEKGRALMSKSSEDQDSVKVKFDGFSVLVVLQNEKASTKGPQKDRHLHDERPLAD